MAENSAIEWTDHTFNPWTGCTKVSPGCAHCYAESWAKRSGTVQWGPGQPRRRTKTWGDPVKWNREASKRAEAYQLHLELCKQSGMSLESAEANWRNRGEKPYHRPRVFSASLADWLDDEAPIEWLADLLKLIQDTPNLDWLLLTKRPENWLVLMEQALCHAEGLDYENSNWQEYPHSTPLGDFINGWIGGETPNNIWIGTTVENQEMADLRIPQLLQIPAKVRFLSCEPLLGPVDLARMSYIQAKTGLENYPFNLPMEHRTSVLAGIDWVICGGESGPGARPMHPDWPRGLRDQCAAAGVPFLFKQWGEWAPNCLCPGENPCTEIKRPDPGLPGVMFRCGKKAAGRHLDGQLHTEFPTA